mmetsp:Transcript_5824/g.12744  ORF Transcript_5824/g.12744 Transcript_5824/m.12744 type:complete len:311 (-) Transcript_5824:271-1203(-)
MNPYSLGQNQLIPPHHILLTQSSTLQLDTFWYGRPVVYHTFDESIHHPQKPTAFQRRRFFLVNQFYGNFNGFARMVPDEIEAVRRVHHGVHLQIRGHNENIFHALHRRAGGRSRQRRSGDRNDGGGLRVNFVCGAVLGMTSPMVVDGGLITGEDGERVHPVLEGAVNSVMVSVELTLYFEPWRFDHDFGRCVDGDDVLGGVRSVDDAGDERKDGIVDAGVAEFLAVARAFFDARFAEVGHQRSNVALCEVFWKLDDAGVFFLCRRCRRFFCFCLLCLLFTNYEFVGLLFPIFEVGCVPISHSLAFGQLFR